MKNQISTSDLLQIKIKNVVDELSCIGNMAYSTENESLGLDILGSIKAIKEKLTAIKDAVKGAQDINVVDTVNNGTITASIGQDDTFGADYDADKMKINNNKRIKRTKVNIIANAVKSKIDNITKMSNEINMTDVESSTCTILCNFNTTLIAINNSLNHIQCAKLSFGDSLRKFNEELNLEPYGHLEDKVDYKHLDELYENRDKYTQKVTDYVKFVKDKCNQ